MVFLGDFPVDSADYENLRDALRSCGERLRLHYEPKPPRPSVRVPLWIPGLLHMEDREERLERRFNLNLSPPRRPWFTGGEEGRTDCRWTNPAKAAGGRRDRELMEPVLLAHIYVPTSTSGPCSHALPGPPGLQKDIQVHRHQRVAVTYEIPLAEVVVRLLRQAEEHLRGYASLDYEPSDTRKPTW